MRTVTTCIAASLALIAAGCAVTKPTPPAAATLAWESGPVFNNPESMLYDRARGRIYVSNVNGAPTDKDGNGYISTMSPDGEVIEARWATGLDAPKGLALSGNRLYVSNIDELVVIDADSGSIVSRYPGEGAKFLNDVAADADGTVYVSDMAGNRLYRLEDGAFDVWVDDTALDQPNGVLVEGDSLVIGSWGPMTADAPVTGALKRVSTRDGSVTVMGSGAPVGNLDGVEPDPSGDGSYLVSDWMAGKLFRIQPSGEFEELLDFEQGSADIGVVADQRLVLVPLMMENKVVAYRIGG